MESKKQLLIVCNTPSANTQALADATVAGAQHQDIDNVDVVFRSALDATADDVLNCCGIIIGTTENFGYMSGLIKDFFERGFTQACTELGMTLAAGLDADIF